MFWRFLSGLPLSKHWSSHISSEVHLPQPQWSLPVKEEEVSLSFSIASIQC